MACRAVAGPPSSRTTRSPRASLPSERPWLTVSMMVGIPMSTSELKTMATMPCTASDDVARERSRAR